MKNVKNLKGAKVLSKNQQQSIHGGRGSGAFCKVCNPWQYCAWGFVCYGGCCIPEQ